MQSKAGRSGPWGQPAVEASPAVAAGHRAVCVQSLGSAAAVARRAPSEEAPGGAQRGGGDAGDEEQGGRGDEHLRREREAMQSEERGAGRVPPPSAVGQAL